MEKIYANVYKSELRLDQENGSLCYLDDARKEIKKQIEEIPGESVNKKEIMKKLDSTFRNKSGD